MGNKVAAAGPRSASRLQAELDTLKTFKGQVDELLTTFHEGEAAPPRIADARLAAGHLGVNFTEANGLHGAYNEVHTQLETFSRLLADQIEALSTAVLGARIGYENVDADLRDRMWAIQHRTEQLYNPTLDPNATPAAPAKRGSDEGAI
ncbi:MULTISPECIES: hypothetical protein [Streptomyces]|uniref:Uncharacterized protein n=1 Tax=Streptomyces luteosporeus TaxID=173856 RepID=A0ABN3TPN7_9ACTN